jgi:tetraacyldisaccharide 4'-kinase
VPDGYGVLASPSEAGDEPYLLATKLAGKAAVISSADRIAAAQEAIKDFGTEVFVLDDGFQHLRLARDLNILCIDATNPWGGGRLLPYGRLRESLEGMSRADCVVLTRCDQVESVDGLREEVVRLIGERPIFESRMRPVRVTSVKNGPETIAVPGRVGAFCAVGNPSSFFASLRQLGYELGLERAFADHHAYSQSEVDELNQLAKQTGAMALITTAKDAVKLKGMAFSLPCYVLEIEININEADDFKKLVLDRIYKIVQD